MIKPNDIRIEQIELQRGPLDFRFDCRIPANGITAVAGPSGSGKTTLLNLIAGFERPDRGRILLSDQDVTTLHPAERPVSLVFQENNLFAHLDIATNIGLGINPALRLTEGDRQRVSAALERTGLGGYEKRMPGTLSGGERQRAAFARALVRDRPYLLLDEPFAALDPGLRLSMAMLLKALQDETGVTVVLVTHNPADVRRLASRVVFLDQGRILADDSTSEFFDRPGPQPILDFRGRDGGMKTGLISTEHGRDDGHNLQGRNAWRRPRQSG